jgi:hypothetical protein
MSLITHGVTTALIVLLGGPPGWADGDPAGPDIDRQLRAALDQAGFTGRIESTLVPRLGRPRRIPYGPVVGTRATPVLPSRQHRNGPIAGHPGAFEQGIGSQRLGRPVQRVEQRPEAGHPQLPTIVITRVARCGFAASISDQLSAVSFCRIGLRPVNAPKARFARRDRPKAYPTRKIFAARQETKIG